MSFNSLFRTFLCASALGIGLNAFAWGSAWTDNGGTTYYNFGGRTGTSWTDNGGTTYYNFGGRTGTSWTDMGGTTYFNGNLFRGQPQPNTGDFRELMSIPNGLGGFDYNYNGTMGRSIPNGLGGFNYSGDLFRGMTTMPNIFGGFDYNYNGKTGRSMPNIFGGFDYSGDLFRGGQQQKSIFANDVFKGKIDENAINIAIRTRNVNALLSSAWDLKGFETLSNVKDEKLNSEKLFSLAAQIAVEQNNAEALKAVISLAPECKKYEEQLAFKSQTRGVQKNVICKTPLPELVRLPEHDWERSLKDDLKEWQQPVADIYLCGMFRGMTVPAAAQAATLINNGRADMKPIMIASGASLLACFDYRKSFSPWFEPVSIMMEAIELAVVLKDKTALEEIQHIYAKSVLKNPELTAYLDEQLAFLGNTRGINSGAKNLQPGDFNLSDMRNILFIGE